ncbi:MULTISPECIES: trimeric intracellular cation channel family protein [Microbacterium]|uniref:trimeric intracellular cation channel family protein n=1 Tax=Microbacterium TaxID=33882 RepID=UPI0027801DCF|nr:MULTISPECIES: TRIC cation channel family protein [Microbacterium]MDQ1082864.1 putative membrane protein YeiH [Microbacterium sp. SORGH_AS_0344]MDQ1168367.1 putative membrane protein YeiH [Microbacterium proteolyticum]
MSPSFEVPLWADLSGVVLGGLQGSAFAYAIRDSRRIHFLGVAFIGILVALGGGVIRDVLLEVPIAALQQPYYVPTAMGAAFIGILIAPLLDQVTSAADYLDALAIAMFAALSTCKALDSGLTLFPAVLVGTLGAVGGGILRDLMLGVPPAAMEIRSLYSATAIAGSVTICGLAAAGVPLIVAGGVGVAVTAVSRILAIWFDVSLPEQGALRRRVVEGWRRRTR